MQAINLEQPLAGFRRRAAAYLIDVGLFFAPLPALFFLLLVGVASGLGDCFDEYGSVGPCGPPFPGFTIALVSLFALVFLSFGWWLLALQWGQTPGKVLMSIQVTKKNGGASGRGYTFVREVMTKGVPLICGLVLLWPDTWILLLGTDWYYRNWEWALYLPFVFVGIVILVDKLWVLLDRESQSLNDKALGTLVVLKQPSAEER